MMIRRGISGGLPANGKQSATFFAVSGDMGLVMVNWIASKKH